MELIDFMVIDKNRSTSKYKQLVASTIEAISSGLLQQGDRMPSINEVCDKLSLSRDTVLSAYNELKSRGILSAHPGKAYYVTSTNVSVEQNIMLLFDELNAFKEDLYRAFMQTIGEQANVDLYFHNFNRKIFSQLLADNNLKYTSYVVMPALFTGISEELARLSGRVYILDQLPLELTNTYPAVYQNFERQVYSGLMEACDAIAKYRKLVSVYPGGKEPDTQLRGFLRFCQDTGTAFEVVSDVKGRRPQRGEAYLVVNDADLVEAVKWAREQGLTIGTDVGIISLNDTSLKEVVANGITTISTNFSAMGKAIGELVAQKGSAQIENPFYLIKRGSL